jgi:hypothetical protein
VAIKQVFGSKCKACLNDHEVPRSRDLPARLRDQYLVLFISHGYFPSPPHTSLAHVVAAAVSPSHLSTSRRASMPKGTTWMTGRGVDRHPRHPHVCVFAAAAVLLRTAPLISDGIACLLCINVVTPHLNTFECFGFHTYTHTYTQA